MGPVSSVSLSAGAQTGGLGSASTSPERRTPIPLTPVPMCSVDREGRAASTLMLGRVLCRIRSARLPHGNSTQLSGAPLIALAILCLLPLLTWVVSAYHGKILSADGAWYVMAIAERGEFNRVSWTRHFSQYATQWLPVIISNLNGVTIELIIKSYEASVVLPAVVTFALLFRWLSPRPELILFPLASFFCVNVGSTHIFMGEHQVLTLAVWPILAFCMFPRRNLFDRACFLALIFLTTRAYEAAVVTHILLLALAVLRLRTAESRTDQAFWLLASCGLAAGILVAAHGILYPRAVASRASFIAHMSIAIFSSFMWIWSPYLAGVVGMLCTGRSVPLWVGAALSAFAVIGFTIAGYELTIGTGFAARSLSIVVTPALMAAMAVLALMPPAERPLFRSMMAATGIVCLVSIGHAWKQEQAWVTHLREFRAFVAAERGFVPAADAPLRWQQSFTWTHSIKSVLLSDRCVTTIVVPPEGGWLPYDPHRERMLTAYRQYGTMVNGEGCD